MATRLPLKQKLIHSAGATGLFLFIYLVTNHFHWREPVLLPQSPLDRVVPFLPATAVIYLSAFALAYLPYVLIEETEELRKYLIAFLSVVILSGVVFTLWPTAYPRALYADAPMDGPGILLRWFRYIDTPANCLPSLHVAVAYLGALAFRRGSPLRFGVLLLWATLIWVSTMTTKQHYWMDGLAGLILALSTTAWVHRAGA